jgi:hypothetical protein
MCQVYSMIYSNQYVLKLRDLFDKIFFLHNSNYIGLFQDIETSLAFLIDSCSSRTVLKLHTSWFII